MSVATHCHPSTHSHHALPVAGGAAARLLELQVWFPMPGRMGGPTHKRLTHTAKLAREELLLLSANGEIKLLKTQMKGYKNQTEVFETLRNARAMQAQQSAATPPSTAAITSWTTHYYPRLVDVDSPGDDPLPAAPTGTPNLPTSRASHPPRVFVRAPSHVRMCCRYDQRVVPPL